VFAADEVDASADFTGHPVELRAGLIAWWLELAQDPEAGPDELRALIPSRAAAQAEA
jgi:hypothetical protein